MRTPLQYASGYSLDLYCDGDEHVPSEQYSIVCVTFFNETFASCARDAKEAGWKIHRKTRTATCPRCRKREHGTDGKEEKAK